MSESKETRKAARLENAGWKTVTVQEFLRLSDEDMAVIEVKVALAKRLPGSRSRRSAGRSRSRLRR